METHRHRFRNTDIMRAALNSSLHRVPRNRKGSAAVGALADLLRTVPHSRTRADTAFSEVYFPRGKSYK